MYVYDTFVLGQVLNATLDGLTSYYKEKHLCVNLSKTQVCAYPEKLIASLQSPGMGTQLTHCPNPVYLGVTLHTHVDRSLTYLYEMHIEKVKAKVSAQNNILTKLGNYRWGAAYTALALCYSCAEYACPVWERSAHAKKLDPALNNACRCITGCLKPTDVNCLYLL